MSAETMPSHDPAPASTASDLAIVGMACRFPGASDLETFWRNLCDGVESITFFNEGELLAAGVEPWSLSDPRYVRAGAILGDVERFDAPFFGMTPRDAQLIDPQQRLFLECAWEGLEDAGYVGATHPGLVGVYAGAGLNLYLLAHLQPNRALLDEVGTWRVFISNDKDFLPTRVAYKLNLRGPAVDVQSACSTSLVAVHLACQGLLNGECDLALAGGSSIRLPQLAGYRHEDGLFFSPDGHTRAFDAQSGGTVFGSGAGVVVLKRLEEALADGDHVYAVIKGSAINNDGSTKVDFTAPSVGGQATVIAEALAVAGVPAGTIGYVEAHGAATALGDPIEVAALTQAYRTMTAERGYCAIGSVKTNVGHLDTAAGVAGLIKTALALHHRQIPPSLNFSKANPDIDFAGSPFHVTTELAEWPLLGAPRRAGVSAFGIGGTNAHVVLEEAPPLAVLRDPMPGERSHHLVTLSAQTEPALAELARRHVRWLGANPAADLGDVAYTTHVGRAAFEHRLAVAAGSAEEVRAELAAAAEGRAGGASRGRTPRGRRPVAGFLFTGQGAEYPGMGRALYQTERVFREALDHCADLLREDLDGPLLQVLFPPAGTESPIHQTAYTQPALFALEHALAELWRSWGVTPAFVMGHSAGEYAAACLAGVFGLEDGLRLIAARGRLMQALPLDGVMVAVRAGEDRVAAAVAPYADQVSLAAINGPESVVISGRREAVGAVRAALEASGVKTTALKISVAAHSPLMEPMLDAFARVAATVTFALPHLPLVSNVTGALETDAVATPEYWVRHIRQPVRFAQGMQTLDAQGCEAYVEIGPKPVLLGMGRQTVTDQVAWLPSLLAGRPDGQVLQQGLGGLWVRGAEIDWLAVDRGRGRRRLSLPTYPFQRQRHWVDAPGASGMASPAEAPKAWPGRRLELPFSTETRFEMGVSPAWPAHLTDHRLEGTVVVPAATHLAWAIDAAGVESGSAACTLEDLVCPQALVLTDDAVRALQLILAPEPGGLQSLRVISRQTGLHGGDSSAWTTHLTGRRRPAGGDGGEAPEAGAAAAAAGGWDGPKVVQARCPRALERPAFYAALGRIAYEAGPSFQWIGRLWQGDDEALGLLQPPEVQPTPETFVLHPGLIDSCFQVFAGCHSFEEGLAGMGSHFVPFRIERFRVHAPPVRFPLWCHARLRTRDEDRLMGDLRLVDADGQLVVEIDGFESRKVSFAALAATAVPAADEWLYEIAWPDAGPLPDLSATTRAAEPGSAPAAPTPEAAPLVPATAAGWLILADETGLGERLGELLADRGQRSVVARAGDHFEATTAGAVGLDPLAPADFGRLLAEAFGPGDAALRGVVHLWGLDEADSVASRSCAGALHLVQALVAAGAAESPRVWLVTRGAQPAVAGDRLAGLAQTPLWGLGRTVALEHPEVGCTLIDLEAPAGDVEGDRTGPASDWVDVDAGALLAAILAPDAETQVAFRGGRRHVARLARRRGPAAAETPRLSADATYLITGGLGGLGLTVARWMVGRGARNLILLGRSDPGEAARSVIAGLERAGARVVTAAGDVADEDALYLAVTRARGGLPPVRGIVHAAGVLGDGLLVHQSWGDFERVLAPKVAGARNLERIARDWPLDHFVLFSSASSVLGSPGQAGYAAANAYLDGLAHRRRALGLAALSLNWGPWAEVGLAARQAAGQPYATWGLESMTPAQALRRLDELFTTDEPQVAILPVQWPTFLRQFRADRRPPFLDGVAGPLGSAPGADASEVRRALAAAPVSERPTILEVHVRAQVAAVLGLATGTPIEPRQRLFDLGLESLTALELKSRLERSLGCTLRSTIVFDYPTLEALTGVLGREVLGLVEGSADRPEEAPSSADAPPGADALAGLSEAEMASLLAEELESLRSRKTR